MESPAPPLHPLLLPELVRRLGENLPRHLLPVCLRVCRLWHAALEPVFWHTLTLQNQPCNFTPRQATPTLVLRNRHHIRHLREVESNSLLKFLAFSIAPPPMQLTSISVSILSPEILMITQQNMDTLTSFSCRSNRLEKDQQAQGLWCRQLFLILAMVPHLSNLTLGPVILLDTPRTIFSQVSRTLKRLELDRVKVADNLLYSDSVAADDITLDLFPRLETLILIWNDFPALCQLELIRKSPNLKSVTWRRGTHLLAQYWLSGALAMPARLSKLDVGSSHIEDQDLARVLALMPNLEVLYARSTLFGTRSGLQLIEHQAQHMRELDVADCIGLSSAIIQRMLGAMPMLRRFCATRLETSDIAQSFKYHSAVDQGLGLTVARLQATMGPWSCVDLEELELTIVGLYRAENPGPDESRLLVYDQLAQLKQLRVLIIRGQVVLHRDGARCLLDLTLQHGLERLASLKRLRELDIQSLPAKMGIDEVAWMAKEWTGLRQVRGLLDSTSRADNGPLERELRLLRPDIVITKE